MPVTETGIGRCPRVQAHLQRLLRERPEATRRELFERFPEYHHPKQKAHGVWREGAYEVDGRLFESREEEPETGGKSEIVTGSRSVKRSSMGDYVKRARRVLERE